jgi:hypothetical protein
MPGMAPRPEPAPRGGIDRMVVTASSDAVPRAWHEQLDPGGRLVVPLRLSDDSDRAHAVTAFVRVHDGFDSVAVTAGGFMPLRRPPAEPPAPSGSEPASAPVVSEPTFTKVWPPEPPSPQRRGPLVDVARDDVSQLRIAVRYGPTRPATRWAVRRGDHWLGIDRLAD